MPALFTTARFYSVSPPPVVYQPVPAPPPTVVVVDRPTVPREPEPVRKPPEEPVAPEVGTFESDLSRELGGPARVGVSFAVGEVRLARGDYQRAVRSLREAVGQAPDEPAPKLALSLALTGAGEYGSAAHLLRRALRAVPDWDEVGLEAETVFGRPARFEAVLQRLHQRLLHEPDNDDARLLAGFLYLASSDAEPALEVLEGAELDGTDTVLESLHWEARRRVQAR